MEEKQKHEKESKQEVSHQGTLGLPSNGILRIYNQFPRCYANIDQMTEQLPLIARMGFNVVWINPIHETGKYLHTLGPDPLGKGKHSACYKGSLYAMHSTDINKDFSIDKDNNNPQQDFDALKRYTAKAKLFGITPIFDLVLNQVSVDAKICEEHSDWFIKSKHFGSGCLDFNYGNSKVKLAIIAYWKGEIYKYIVEFGFVGVRVDAAKHLPNDVQIEIYGYINECCEKTHNAKPIIYAEIIAGGNELGNLSKEMEALGITHVMNSIYHNKFTKTYRESARWNEGSGRSGNMHHGLYLLREIVRNKSHDIVGGTVGFVGSHDYKSLYDSALHDQAFSILKVQNNFKDGIANFNPLVENKCSSLKIQSIQVQTEYLKERIAAIAFTSDAGWCLLSGDEYGHPGRKWVFDFYRPCGENNQFSFKDQWGGAGKFDLCSFIYGVNLILGRLPSPKNDSYWVQHVVLQNKPLMVVVRHNSHGFNQPAELIIINLSNDPCILAYKDIKEIADSASYGRENHSQAQQSILKAQIFCLGSFKYEENFKLHFSVDPATAILEAPSIQAPHTSFYQQQPSEAPMKILLDLTKQAKQIEKQDNVILQFNNFENAEKFATTFQKQKGIQKTIDMGDFGLNTCPSISLTKSELHEILASDSEQKKSNIVYKGN